MIKRLKWNVLHGGGGGEESDGGLSSSSDESDVDSATRQDKANVILSELVECDPDMAELLHKKLQAVSSSSEDEGEGGEVTDGVVDDGKTSIRAGKNKSVEEMSDSEESTEFQDGRVGENGGDETPEAEASDTEYAEWRECDICPGKRFLNDKEVESHLSSRKHKRAEAKLLKRDQKAGTDVGMDNGTKSVTVTGQDSSPVGDPKVKEERLEKRKAAAKRKLKALKRRKWEQKLQNENQASEDQVTTMLPGDKAVAVADFEKSQSSNLGVENGICGRAEKISAKKEKTKKKKSLDVAEIGMESIEQNHLHAKSQLGMSLSEREKRQNEKPNKDAIMPEVKVLDGSNGKTSKKKLAVEEKLSTSSKKRRKGLKGIEGQSPNEIVALKRDPGMLFSEHVNHEVTGEALEKSLATEEKGSTSRRRKKCRTNVEVVSLDRTTASGKGKNRSSVEPPTAGVLGEDEKGSLGVEKTSTGRGRSSNSGKKGLKKKRRDLSNNTPSSPAMS